jgi:hypothetical protein
VIPHEHIQKMCGHLRDTRFLGSHGLHAVSPHDRRHFALHDIDWGGGGCFVGHVAIVIEGLAASGQRDLADAVLERIAWMGTALPYLPQSARADAPSAFQDRPNALAAAAICQALLARHRLDSIPKKHFRSRRKP